MRTISTGILAMLVLALTCSAQTSTGSMSGTVVDAQQAAVPNATVTLTEQNKQTTLNTVTDQEGRFTFPNLLPGRYALSVQGQGFKKSERKDITLLANDRLSVGMLQLEVGTVSESVEVSAEAVLLKTESAERSSALTTNELQNVAVNSRSYLQLAGMLPGVVSTANLTTAGHAGLANISANGARFDQNNLTLDGIGNVDTGNNGDQLATVSLDSVQEFKMLTSNYQAEYGRSSGAQISVVTKSGSTNFHGSAYWWHRHEGLNANNWKNNRDRLPRNLFRFNDPGYTIGGPVYIPRILESTKNKMFFFWSQEFQEQLRPQGRRDATFPTELERQGNFSQSVDRNGNPIPQLKDPRGGVFSNNIIPQDRLYAPGVAVLNWYPKPNNISTANRGFNYTSQIPDSYPRREDLIRIDYNFSSNWRMFGRYLHNKDAFTSAYGSFVLGSGFPLVPIRDSRPGYALALSLNGVLSPTLTNELNWGFGKNIINIDPTTDGLTRTATGINIPMLYPKAVQQDFIPRFAYGGTRIGGQQQFGTNNAPFYNFNTTIDWIDNVTKVWNQHVIKAGIYVQRSRKDQTSFAAANGDINFADASSNPLDTGFGFANMALGVYTSYTQASQYATGRYRYTNAEWYVQDTWKVNRRLTLDYGLRFQWIQPQFDSALQTSTFLPDRFDPAKAPRIYRPVGTASNRRAVDPGTGQILDGTYIGKIVNGTGDPLNGIVQAGQGISKYLIENRGIHYAPRFGFAFDVTGNQRMVLRGGGGIFYDRFQGNEVFDMITNPPTTFAPTLVNGLLSELDPDNIQIGPSNLHAFDFNGNVPTVYNYSLGLQTRILENTVLDVSYVGSLSRHQLQRVNLNAIPYGATFLSQNVDPTRNAGLPGANALDAVFLRSYQGYGDITLHQFGGTANYNSLQTSLTRRFANRLDFGVNYTWAKALGTSDDRGNFNRIDQNTRLANYALLSFHRAHTLGAYYTFEVPNIFATGTLKSRLIDGWQVSGNTTFQTGSPFTPGYSIAGASNPNITGSYTEGARLALVGDPEAGTSDSPYNRLNAAAFAAPQVGSIGLEAPRNYMINPGINNWNISLQKMFEIREGVRLQLRGDAFNAFNHTQFSGINSGLNFSSYPNPVPNNLYLNANGTVNNINGFGTVSGARDPRIMQLGMRLVF